MTSETQASPSPASPPAERREDGSYPEPNREGDWICHKASGRRVLWHCHTSRVETRSVIERGDKWYYIDDMIAALASPAGLSSPSPPSPGPEDIERVATEIVEDLFAMPFSGLRAERIALIDKSGRDMGGWGFAPAVRIVSAVLRSEWPGGEGGEGEEAFAASLSDYADVLLKKWDAARSEADALRRELKAIKDVEDVPDRGDHGGPLVSVVFRYEDGTEKSISHGTWELSRKYTRLLQESADRCAALRQRAEAAERERDRVIAERAEFSRAVHAALDKAAIARNDSAPRRIEWLAALSSRPASGLPPQAKDRPDKEGWWVVRRGERKFVWEAVAVAMWQGELWHMAKKSTRVSEVVKPGDSWYCLDDLFRPSPPSSPESPPADLGTEGEGETEDDRAGNLILGFKRICEVDGAVSAGIVLTTLSGIHFAASQWLKRPASSAAG